MTKLVLAAAIGGMLLIAAACGGGGDGGGDGDGDRTATPSPALDPEVFGTPDPALSVRCIDQATLPGPGPFEVGEEPVFFRFGLPDEVLQSGEVCPGDLRLVSLRITVDIGEGAPVLRFASASGDAVSLVSTQLVEVPGEEGTGTFYNAVVELPGAGTWDFSVNIPGVSATYVVPVRMPPPAEE